MARNELFNLAYTDEYDAMVFIDDDEYWTAQVLIDIINSNNGLSLAIVSSVLSSVHGTDKSFVKAHAPSLSGPWLANAML